MHLSGCQTKRKGYYDNMRFRLGLSLSELGRQTVV